MQAFAPNRRDVMGLLLGSAASASLARPAFGQSRSTPGPGFKVEPDRELRVAVRGGNIYVRVNGDLNGPRAPVIMIHGGPGGDHVGFLPALPLTEVRAVVLYDQLDCGRSDWPRDPANWTVERFVSEIDAIREALGVKALHLVGHSWGGTIAAEYAARQPAGLRSLVLQGAFLSSKVWNDDARRLSATLPQPMPSTLQRCEAADFPKSDSDCSRATAMFYRAFNGSIAPPAYVTEYYVAMRRAMRQMANPPGPDVYETMWGRNELKVTGALKDYDAEPLLPRIAVPTLYLSGEFDEGTPQANARFAARTRSAEVMTIPGATHSVQYDEPRLYADTLHSWLVRHDP